MVIARHSLGLSSERGYFGETRLDGVQFAKILRFPGPVHEGNGVQQLIVDERALPAQREALIAINSGAEGGTIFEIFAAVCPTVVPPRFAPIELSVDRERRRGRLHITGIGESEVEPIRNPVTGEEHRARIVLLDGFEYKEAEMGNTRRFWVKTSHLSFAHENCYAQLNAFDWSNR